MKLRAVVAGVGTPAMLFRREDAVPVVCEVTSESTETVRPSAPANTQRRLASVLGLTSSSSSSSGRMRTQTRMASLCRCRVRLLLVGGGLLVVVVVMARDILGLSVYNSVVDVSAAGSTQKEERGDE